MTKTAITFALGALAAIAGLGCDGGSAGAPADPPPDASSGLDAGVAEAGADAEAGYAVCVPDIDASYTALLTTIFSTGSCGTDQMFDCHSSSGASAEGTGNLLDFTLDAGAVYAELLGADGGGHTATNLAGDSGGIPILRVAPNDAGASMLYVKLTLTTHDDPRYGAGMPLTDPGSVCPATLDAVKAWIDNGAQQN
jgi:hypothetical protein